MTEHQIFHTSNHGKTSPEVEVPFDLQVRQHATRARQMQAEAMAASLAGAWHNASRAMRASADWLREQRRRAQTRRALMACSDRTLADIGIPRGYIHLAARGVDLRDPLAVSEAGLWPRLAASIRRLHHKRLDVAYGITVRGDIHPREPPLQSLHDVSIAVFLNLFS